MVTPRSIMAAILLIQGPVCTKTCIGQFGPLSIRGITQNQFLEAAWALQEANLGSLITLKHRNGVFIKRVPSEMGNRLEAHQDMCTIERYTARFSMPPPTIIEKVFQDQLVRDGYVKAEHFVSKIDYLLKQSGSSSY